MRPEELCLGTAKKQRPDLGLLERPEKKYNQRKVTVIQKPPRKCIRISNQG